MHHQRSACEASTSQGHRPGQPGGHLGPAYPRLDQRADEQPGVQHDHERVVAPAGLDAAALTAPGGVAHRHDQLGQPLEADERDQDREGDQALHVSRPPAAAPARSRSPGPSRAACRGFPGAGGRSRSVSSSTWSTDADDRLPTAASDSQVSRTASRGISSAVSSASITFGPPGWQTHQPMSARVRPWSARNSSTSCRR